MNINLSIRMIWEKAAMTLLDHSMESHATKTALALFQSWALKIAATIQLTMADSQMDTVVVGK